MSLTGTFRDRLFAAFGAAVRGPADELAQMRTLVAECEARRARARYNTGTISEAAALYLRCLTQLLKPAKVVEIGTFIGTSAMAMLLGHPTAWIYTCDGSNDCGPSSHQIRCHPYTGSTTMLSDLRRHALTVELFFMDGRIKPEDLPLILALSSDTTVYAFDDYEGREKGVLNVERLQPWLHPKLRYELLEPPPIEGVTIALLVPGALL